MAYSELVKRTLVSVVETETSMRQIDALLPASSREALIGFLAFNPEAGDAIPGTGGIRKVRWAVAGKGKRGGLRVIYAEDRRGCSGRVPREETTVSANKGTKRAGPRPQGGEEHIRQRAGEEHGAGVSLREGRECCRPRDHHPWCLPWT